MENIKPVISSKPHENNGVSTAFLIEKIGKCLGKEAVLMVTLSDIMNNLNDNMLAATKNIGKLGSTLATSVKYGDLANSIMTCVFLVSMLGIPLSDKFASMLQGSFLPKAISSVGLVQAYTGMQSATARSGMEKLKGYENLQRQELDLQSDQYSVSSDTEHAITKAAKQIIESDYAAQNGDLYFLYNN